MMPRKVLDLRRFPGLPKFIVFNDDDRINKPYSSWDIVNNSRRLVKTDMYRRHDVIFSSPNVCYECLEAIWNNACVVAHYELVTAPCVVHVFDVVDQEAFIECCLSATKSDKDFALIIHEAVGVYRIVSGNGTVVFGYLTEDLTYDRR